MDWQKLLLALFTVVATVRAAPFMRPVLFHATSVVETSSNGAWADHTICPADYFSYMTEKGFFSFGWWGLRSNRGNATYFTPDADPFHWFELGERESCDSVTGACLYSTQNVPIRFENYPQPPPCAPMPLKYIERSLGLGDGDEDRVELTYTDDDGVQAQGLSTRQKLSGDPSAAGTCHKALRILKQLYEQHDIDLGFEIGNPCAQGTSIDQQEVSEL
ncbi:uncharacterized protein F4817DRAFT_332088 [Daldinia loculata]|uniref:uncharacterized protein n=1 Tax=Daldinia loculata TaxID=103429 RepID=UPI0020C4D36B|nr:uncharacterized protein F4817DRAFT_332088 [Daldinia loculata]KAI1649190.1 hypothetical protein F4817DRAFT_332088 [Daldinia loculata]